MIKEPLYVLLFDEIFRGGVIFVLSYEMITICKEKENTTSYRYGFFQVIKKELKMPTLLFLSPHFTKSCSLCLIINQIVAVTIPF